MQKLCLKGVNDHFVGMMSTTLPGERRDESMRWKVEECAN